MSGEPPLVFLDANVLFSATMGGPAFELLLAMAHAGSVRLVTSRACVAEAETNLERKRPEGREAIENVLGAVGVVADAADDEIDAWARALVHADDVHVLAAARRSGADVLLTGDTTHFGPLMEREDLGLRVRTPRAFILEGPR